MIIQKKKPFMFIEHNYTLVTAWTFSNDNSTTKTITGCVANEPIILCHCPTGTAGMCYTCVTAGASDAKTGTNDYLMGTSGDYGEASVKSIVIVPNATSVTVQIHFGKDDKSYVYR